ncbi:MAG: hypothetical protein WAV40_00840 [Microgenomates group bacterium]
MSQQFIEKFFPNYLAPTDTQEILENIPRNGEWKLTDFPRRYPDIYHTDKILQPWVLFSIDASRGLANAQAIIRPLVSLKSRKDLGKAIMDSPANQSYILWTEALGSKAGDKQTITSVQSAFAILLSEQALASLPKKVKRDIVVDEKLRSTIDQLVTNMHTLAMRHRASENHRWKKIYGED